MAASRQRSEIVERIAETIRTHYAEHITLPRLAESIGKHRNYISLVFREQMGVSVHDYLTRHRLECAADLIKHGDKIEAVSMCVGYRSKRSFYRQFKRYFGTTPEQYRRRGPQ